MWRIDKREDLHQQKWSLWRIAGQPSKDLGITSSPEECKVKCELSFQDQDQDEYGCCSRISDGHCWWYPESTTTCCWASSYSAAQCTTIDDSTGILFQIPSPIYTR